MSHTIKDSSQLKSDMITAYDLSKIDIRGELKFGNHVTIDVNVIFKGSVSIGDNVTIGANCILEDCIIADNVTIKEFTSISNAQIHAQASVGPYARIRPNTIVGENSQVGNFVEIKNSSIGKNCKISHHAFIGDTNMHDNVIFAASSITCNYDGEAFNHTIIERNVFIGSGVLLLAPVHIGENVFVAAGSTITENIPANKLAISRTKDVILKDRHVKS